MVRARLLELKEFNSQHSARCQAGAHYTKVIIFKPQQEGRMGFVQMLSKFLPYPQMTPERWDGEGCSGLELALSTEVISWLWKTNDKQDLVY